MSESVVDYLRYGKKQVLMSAYLAAASDGYWSIVKTCLAQDPSIKEALDRENRTAAALAVEYNHVNVLMGLMDGDFLAKCEKVRGETCFLAANERVRDICFLAASRGRLNLVEAIFSRSIPEGMDKDGRYHHVLCVSAAHGATLHGHTDIVQWVAKRTALRDLIDDDGNTLLMMTHLKSLHSNIDTIKWIVDNGNIDIHRLNRWRSTALGMAATNHRYEVMKVLVIKGGANLEDRFPGYASIFFAILALYQYEMVQWMILERGQDVNAVDDKSSTALMIMARQNQTEMVQWLVDVGKADTTCLSSNKVFYSLLQYKNREVLEWLMVHGHVDANRMVDGEPAFFHVARKKYLSLLMKLFDSGRADVTKVARDGTSIWLAMNWDNLKHQKYDERDEDFIRIVAPRLAPPEQIVQLLSTQEYLSGLLRSTKIVREKVVRERQRRSDAMKASLPPTVLRDIVMEFDTMTTKDMYKL